MTATARSRFVVLAGLLGAVLAGACGAPTEDRPRALNPSEVPFGLLTADPVSTTTTTVPSGESSTVTVFFMGGQRLVPVEREVARPASVEKVLKALINGPTDEERARGLRSAINPGATVLAAPVQASIATVDISGFYFLGAGEEQIIALAQTVFTATSLAGVVAVRFTLDGERAEVPIGTGARIASPVGRVAYAAYDPAQ